jgi:hypothetical protein
MYTNAVCMYLNVWKQSGNVTYIDAGAVASNPLPVRSRVDAVAMLTLTVAVRLER